ncbi:c-type cytochrome biogenesis protein CcmI [Rhodoplanes sp. TEM]|uniref:C-type cytochrome biogenesis protein CcmI n=1 Tax=Rhodoplanes tepidamans TaxID=200616 RepID=A0ABT5JI12_RHOTP|nr:MULTISPECIES: c-type cytochrome biogenesis protein CcmI [Rhodoplanes]MDC7788675.1 c-type cytochrome biogenesis protein CcmI [Rhodoplanes tepidamans]MDC7984409.1 c-type cytochrome biogenesis protein CcmI [Rhodoplanes sp. TEM]MDQ0358321.1 cytochrome c-type biogenesis protein CcmH [Rhodoplanes tepidamans]
MMLSFLLALMTAVALGAALWPLIRRTGPGRGGDDVAVYRDQLDEIERDLSLGAIGPAEAEAARVEVSRRLIAAAEAARAPVETPISKSPGLRKAAAAVLVALPLAGLGWYLVTGSPEMPAQPLAQRLARLHAGKAGETDQNAAMAAMVPRVEAHLRTNPEDGRGWAVLAPAYMRLERFDEAVKAYRNAIRLLGETGDRVADLGEALTSQAGGIVTPSAKAQFERARVLDKDHVSATYYLGLAARQAGRPDEARTLWQGLLDRAPADAPWAGFVKTALAGLDAPGPGGVPAEVPQALSEEQKAMVRGMLDQLTERLRRDGTDVEGWLRLIRSHLVMRDLDRARATLAEARRALADLPDRLVRLEAEARAFRLDAGGPAGAAAAPAAGPRVAAPAAGADIALPAPARPSGAVEKSASADTGADYDETMRGLIDRLARRLAQDGSDVDGWLRLVRTHMALGERDRATVAVADARKALAGAPDKLARLDTVVKELGLSEAGSAAGSGAVQ